MSLAFESLQLPSTTETTFLDYVEQHIFQEKIVHDDFEQHPFKE